MNGFWAGLWPWLVGGLVWWGLGIALAFPYRYRHRRWARWCRPALGLPLHAAAWLEAWRSRWRGLARRGRVTRPYRGFAPFGLSLLVAEALCVALWALARLL